jgi:hypothetical protein
MQTGNSLTSHVRTSLRRGRVPALAVGAALALSALAPVSAASALASGSISGVVTDDLGDPLEGIEVTVYDLDPSTGDVAVETVTTSAGGAYLIEGIAADPYYRVGFSDPDGVWATEYYDDTVTLVAGNAPFAQWVPVLDGDDTGGIDASLEAGAEISGRVTVGAGGAVQHGSVDLWWRYAAQAWVRVGTYSTDQDGSYSIPGVRGEDYRLDFTDPGTGATGSTSIAVASGVDRSVDAHLGGVVKSATAPAIAGPPQIGQTLTASSAWTPADAAVAYRWVVGDDTTPADDPTGATYAPSAQDLGKTIRVVATAAKGAGWVSATATSAPTAPVAAAPVAPLLTFVNDRLPKIKGTLRVGKTVRVTRGEWTPFPATITYTWFAGKQVFQEGDRRWAKLTKKQAGKRLRVQVTVSAPSYADLVLRTKRTPEKVAPKRSRR